MSPLELGNIVSYSRLEQCNIAVSQTQLKNIQYNMSPLELNSPITVFSEQYNFVVSQDKAFIIAFMNMLKVHKEDMNESINEIYENTNQT